MRNDRGLDPAELDRYITGNYGEDQFIGDVTCDMNEDCFGSPYNESLFATERTIVEPHQTQIYREQERIFLESIGVKVYA